jgi:uncharacterized membrane protein HdeD (DUF308 family)
MATSNSNWLGNHNCNITVVVILNPLLGFISLVWIVGVLLFVIGIEMMVSHMLTPHRSRFAGVALGIAVIILAIISIGFPLIAS